jgi:hypothetical protein
MSQHWGIFCKTYEALDELLVWLNGCREILLELLKNLKLLRHLLLVGIEPTDKRIIYAFSQGGFI